MAGSGSSNPGGGGGKVEEVRCGEVEAARGGKESDNERGLRVLLLGEGGGITV